MMLARRMGKKRIIAETGAGQHGVATATVAARFGLECIVYMGERDIERQQPNVFRMKLLGAEVRPVSSGSRTLKDALNEALRDWVSNPLDTFYVIGTVAGPHPYPAMVRDFQSIIGTEAKAQLHREGGPAAGRAGGGRRRRLQRHGPVPSLPRRPRGADRRGRGRRPRHRDRRACGGDDRRAGPGILHGQRSYLLQDEDGQVIEPHSISAGLDYPGIGPELSWLKDLGRIEVEAITDDEALAAFSLCSRLEGILPGTRAQPRDRPGGQAGADARP